MYKEWTENGLKPSQDLCKAKLKKKPFGPVISEIISIRQKTLILYVIVQDTKKASLKSKTNSNQQIPKYLASDKTLTSLYT